MVKLIEELSPEQVIEFLENANPRSDYYLRNAVSTCFGPDVAEKADYNELRRYWGILYRSAIKKNKELKQKGEQLSLFQ